jgi:hypothetical protein
MLGSASASAVRPSAWLMVTRVNTRSSPGNESRVKLTARVAVMLAGGVSAMHLICLAIRLPASGSRLRFHVIVRGCPPIARWPNPHRPRSLSSATTVNACPSSNAARSAAGSPAGCQRRARTQFRATSAKVTLPADRLALTPARSSARPRAGASSAARSAASTTGGAVFLAIDRAVSASPAISAMATGQATSCACQPQCQMTCAAPSSVSWGANTQKYEPHRARIERLSVSHQTCRSAVAASSRPSRPTWHCREAASLHEGLA